jgi:hypothetical protein
LPKTTALVCQSLRSDRTRSMIGVYRPSSLRLCQRTMTLPTTCGLTSILSLIAQLSLSPMVPGLLAFLSTRSLPPSRVRSRSPDPRAQATISGGSCPSRRMIYLKLRNLSHMLSTNMTICHLQSYLRQPHGLIIFLLALALHRSLRHISGHGGRHLVQAPLCIPSARIASTALARMHQRLDPQWNLSDRSCNIPTVRAL